MDMEYTKTITINVGDNVECLTSDGWECGTVTEVTTDKIKADMGYIGEEMEFKLEFVRL